MVNVPRHTETPPRDGRAWLATRENGAYSQYVTDERRRQAGCSAGRMQRNFHHGPLVASRRERYDLGLHRSGDRRLVWPDVHVQLGSDTESIEIDPWLDREAGPG